MKTKISCVLIGVSSVGKHTLISWMHKDGDVFEDETQFLVSTEHGLIAIRPYIIDESISSKKRKKIYMKVDALLFVFAFDNAQSLKHIVDVWLPEVNSLSAKPQMFIVGTKLDRIDESNRQIEINKGNELSQKYQMNEFFWTLKGPSAPLLTKKLFQSLTVTTISHDIVSQIGKKKRASSTQSLSHFWKKGVTLASQKSMGQSGLINQDYICTWRGELICFAIESFVGGEVILPFHDFFSRNMIEPLSLDEITRGAAKLAKKLTLFYHFHPVLLKTFENHNFDFILEADMLRHFPEFRGGKNVTKIFKREATRIFREYIPNESFKEIFIPKEITNDVTLKLKILSRGTFAAAQAFVLQHLIDLFQEKMANSYAVTELTNVFKSIKELPLLMDENETTIATPIGEDLCHILRRGIHIITLMELLYSNATNDKRPNILQFFKEEDSSKLSQLSAKYLLVYMAFTHHIEKEQSQENLMFWLDVEDFRSLEPGLPKKNESIESFNRRVKDQLVIRAEHIVDRYIKSTAEWLINLPATMTKSIVQTLKDISENNSKDEIQRLKCLFENAHKEIFLLVKRDAWKRFQASPDCQQLKDSFSQLFSLEAYIDPEEEKEVSRFQAKFELTSDEVVVRTFQCVVEKKMLLHGELQLSRRHFCFYSSVFGFKTKLCYNFSEIVEITTSDISPQYVVEQKKGNKSKSEEDIVIIIITKDKEVHLIRKVLPNHSLLLYLMRKLRSRVHNGRKLSINVPGIDKQQGDDDENAGQMTDSDWELLQEGAEIVEYKKGDIILSEGQSAEYIFQIARGRCRIEKKTSQGPVTLRICETDEFIGEISFIEGGTISATVVAHTDEVAVYQMSRSFVEKLMIENPGLPGRFFKFLALLLADRLQTKKEIHDEKRKSGSTQYIITDKAFRSYFGFIDQEMIILIDLFVSLDDKFPIYGHLFLSQTTICFYSKILGSLKRMVFPITESKIELIDNTKIKLIHTLTNNEFYFSGENFSEFITAYQCQINEIDESGANFDGEMDDLRDDIDWSLFLQGTELKEYNANEVIFQQNQEIRKVFQIVQGSVEVSESTIESPRIVKTLGTGELFGEMDFLQGGPSKVTIKAFQNGTLIYSVSKDFVDQLAAQNAQLPGRFYKFLSASLANRLRK